MITERHNLACHMIFKAISKTGSLGSCVVSWLGAPQQHRQPPVEPPTDPRQHRPKDLSKHRRDIYLVEIKYCEDTRPQNQLNAAKEQHKDLCNTLQGASVTIHIILLGVGSTIYNTHTLKPFKDLGLDPQRVKKLASKLHVHSMNFAAKLVQTRRALAFQYYYQLSSGAGFRPSLQPSWSPLIFPFLFAMKELYGTRYQNGSSFLLN